MSYLGSKRGSFLCLALVTGIVLGPLVPASAWVSAQGEGASLWVVRSLVTMEYGVESPGGLAFSSASGTFLLTDGSAQVTAIAMDAEPAGGLHLSDAQAPDLNMAFDESSGGLYILKPGQSELVRLGTGPGGLPAASDRRRFGVSGYGIQDPQGITFDAASGRLYILDAGKSQVVSIAPHPVHGFDGVEVIRGGRLQRIPLKQLGNGSLRGIAHNPANGHLYVASPSQKLLYELELDGTVISTFDLTVLGIHNPVAATFAPSVDNTDDPAIFNLFLLDGEGVPSTAMAGVQARAVAARQTDGGSARIVEVSLIEPAALPPGTPLLPSTLVRTFDTSNAVWNPSAPDPAGIDYWPLTGRLFIVDSEVDEMPNYFQGKNVYESTLSGSLVKTCSTTSFTNEPTGVAINPNNNHIFISTDANDRVFEIDLGADGVYCTADDTVTTTNVSTLYGITDAEDVAYGNNTLFIAGGADAEVYRIPLGANGVLGGGDDGAMTHFDTLAWGFTDMEGIGYNQDAGTLFIVSTKASDRYMGEVTTTGTLLRAYDLALMGSAGNIRSDVTYAPASQNPANKSIYIVSRGVDNNNDPNENDGKVWEINIAGPGTPTPSLSPTNTTVPTNTTIPTSTTVPTDTLVPTSTTVPTDTLVPTNTTVPTSTLTVTPGPSPTPTSTPSSSSRYVSFDLSTGSVGGVAYADEDILELNGSSWSMFFDGSDVGVGSLDLLAFSIVDADTLLLSFNSAITLGGLVINPQDIVRFDATSLGSTTAGTFSMYFDGSDVGLAASAENIDALALLPDGRILISTTGSSSVPGVSGLDEDVLAFAPTSLGSVTSGTWAMYFDGSDVGLADTNNEDVDALEVASNGAIYLSTIGVFSVNGVSGDDEDVFVCTPTSLGSVTACSYSPQLYFDGSAFGLASADVDAFGFSQSAPLATATPTNTAVPTHTPTPGPSPTATETPSSPPTLTPTTTNPGGGSELIFVDGFESGDLSAWTSSTIDLGDLSVSAGAALHGSLGLQAVINDTNSLYVTDDSPLAEPRYRARFYFDPNSIAMASGNAHYIFKGFSGNSTDVLRVEFRFSSGAYQLRAALTNDASAWLNTNWFTISDTPHIVELDWLAASAVGANNGGLTIWIDGTVQEALSGIDNDTWRVDRARLGALSGIDTGTSGTYYFDAFESRRQTYIGP